MALKKEKLSDGFFVFEQTTIPMDEWNPEIEQAINDLFDNIRNIESQLNCIEKRIHELQETPQGKAGRQSPKLQKHHDKYKDLNQVKSYTDKALGYLKQARENLIKRDTEQAMVDTIYMMDAYWHGFIHTEAIKASILREKCQSTGQQNGGNIRAKKYENCRKDLAHKASTVWAAQKRPKSVEWMTDYLLKNHADACVNADGETVSKSSVRNYIKEFKPTR